MPYLIALAVIIIAGIGFTFFQSSKTNEPTTVAPIEQKLTEEKPAPKAVAAYNYKDGTYTKKVTYTIPAPPPNLYTMDISLDVKNDIVVSANIVYNAEADTDPNAQAFEAAYRSQVVGKKVDSLNLSRVGGASLSTQAFNGALAQIKTEAKS